MHLPHRFPHRPALVAEREREFQLCTTRFLGSGDDGQGGEVPQYVIHHAVLLGVHLVLGDTVVESLPGRGVRSVCTDRKPTGEISLCKPAKWRTIKQAGSGGCYVCAL